jgi:hypothetical protein
MSAAQSPLVGLQMDAETATYVGMLEGQLAAHVIQEAKFRALLELLTGESWETTRIDVDAKGLQKIAEDGLVKKAGLNRVNAKTLVQKRWQNLTAGTAVVPKAVSIEELKGNTTAPVNQANTVAPQTTPQVTMADRLAGWKARQQAASEPPPGPSEPTATA